MSSTSGFGHSSNYSFDDSDPFGSTGPFKHGYGNGDTWKRTWGNDCLSFLSSKSLENPKRVDKDLHGFGPLFDETLGILGTESIAADRDAPCGFSISKESQLKGNTAGVESKLHQLQGVCENAEEKSDQINIGNLSALGDNDNAILDGIEFTDVYPIVRKVTEIVRTENSVPPMEERLEKADFNYNEEVVEKVLKNCFKYPHLALRFFNWVKFSKGFRHTTNTFTMMINVAGEAKELSLVEDLAEEMVRSSCNMNVKTWTILLSHYGKSKLISKSLLVFENMRKSGVEPDAIAYRIMLGALCNGGRSDLALEFYKDMVHNEVNLDLGLCKQLLKCFALSGDVTSVYLVGENMKKNSEISEPQIYHLMLKSFCIAGRIRESLELIRDLKNKNVILDAGIFETLVKGLCSKDRITDAMEILEIMKKKNVFDENIYRILISTYLRRNEVAEALSLFEEAKKYGNISVSTYTNLMQHLFWKNEFQKGLELYDEMLEMGLELDCVAITAAAVGYVRKNCISEAWEEIMAEENTVRTMVKFLSHEQSEEREEVVSLLYELSRSEKLCEKIGSRENNVRQMADCGRLQPLLTLLLGGKLINFLQNLFSVSRNQ
ncbi:PREDICTED: putative pentatricopeptide repeat-containing protein At5g06400, mitochondrial [Erythranthe guttata]|uniref:putative pentatricopeptide repeat-containing protein At5g06400, mitochondrial n=1 Tax=Erythranthe guttata TaxID=4155 RepID=UPI00064DDD77|nr:PREDICTED: putative pentatricopeptide repeat-containing protein At5g06400, mitochondrial [Erythranthe guttata]|eukprot:XP_012832752.1 PREDICTED: putative pentatricopeptide repeat-containing protein At5g06400, mitochondrial [Erythranthe guttata]